MGLQRRTDVHSTDLVVSDEHPVAAAGQYFAVQPRSLDHPAIRDEGQSGADLCGDQLCRLKFDVHIEEMLGRQPVEQRQPVGRR